MVCVCVCVRACVCACVSLQSSVHHGVSVEKRATNDWASFEELPEGRDVQCVYGHTCMYAGGATTSGLLSADSVNVQLEGCVKKYRGQD